MKIFIKVRGILQNIPWVTIVLKTEKCRYNTGYCCFFWFIIYDYGKEEQDADHGGVLNLKTDLPRSYISDFQVMVLACFRRSYNIIDHKQMKR